MIMNVPPDEMPYFQLGFIFTFSLCLIGFVLSIGYLIWELIRLISGKDVIEYDITDSNDIKIIPEGKSMKKRSVLVVDTPETCGAFSIKTTFSATSQDHYTRIQKTLIVRKAA